MKKGIANNPYMLYSAGVAKPPKMEEDAIIEYIEQHGFGQPTPPLTKTLSADVFKQHYYEKTELMEFCRSVGISTSGLKEDLNGRIELFLRTGQVTVVESTKKKGRADSETGLALDKAVVNYKSDAITREFFERNIPGFTGFSALVQKQIRERLEEGDDLTYADIIEMHKAFLTDKLAAKKSGRPTKVAHGSCQYNQFSVDYSHDRATKLHSIDEAWMLVRNSAGDKTYQRYKDKIEEIRGIVRAGADTERNASARPVMSANSK